MSFAPYQDIDPSTERALSPPPAQSRSSRITSPPPTSRQIASPRRVASPPSFQSTSHQQQQQQQSSYQSQRPGGGGDGDYDDVDAGDVDVERAQRYSRREELDPFETRLGIRLDYEACLAYLALPPAGGVALLVLEHKSDYVRFHAWQSSLLFAFLFIVHIIFSWTAVISWLLFVVDLGLIGLLTYRAYKDAETLDRFEVPFFGRLASQILDDE